MDIDMYFAYARRDGLCITKEKDFVILTFDIYKKLLQVEDVSNIIKSYRNNRVMTMKINVGDMVYIPSEKKPYKVQARDDRFIICTKPYNPKHTVLYFIIDLVRKVRGTDNMIFCNGYETQEQCENNLKKLQDGLMEVSYRNVVPLDVEVE